MTNKISINRQYNSIYHILTESLRPTDSQYSASPVKNAFRIHNLGQNFQVVKRSTPSGNT